MDADSELLPPLPPPLKPGMQKSTSAMQLPSPTKSFSDSITTPNSLSGCSKTKYSKKGPTKAWLHGKVMTYAWVKLNKLPAHLTNLRTQKSCGPCVTHPTTLPSPTLKKTTSTTKTTTMTFGHNNGIEMSRN